MKIAVFGATGGTGRSLVEQALAEGHEVIALARRPDALQQTDPRLTVITGDAHDADVVAKVVDGADAVACVIGLAKPEGTEVSEATRTICQAMTEAGVRRLVTVTIMGLDDSVDNFTRAGKLFVRLFLQKGMEDRARQENVIRATELDYTFVRPSRLADGDGTGRYSTGPEVRAGLSSKLVRADLADFLLKQLSTTGSAARAVSIVGD